jgi:hypothetical protein
MRELQKVPNASGANMGCTIRSGEYVLMTAPALGEHIMCDKSAPYWPGLVRCHANSLGFSENRLLATRKAEIPAKNGAPV